MTSSPPCPLCGATGSQTIFAVGLDEIWRSYAAVHDTVFSQAVRGTYGHANFTLRECDGCNLQWFLPAVEGDAAFYSELFRGGIRYEPWRWEFDEATTHVPPGSRVVEVGAGEGAFLRSITDRCASVEVLDRNPDAARQLRGAGIRVVETDLAVDADTRPDRADVVCAFQVVEHVADVAGFLRSLGRIAVPGGKVLISVPNRRRVGSGALEPMDTPPHHLTRWAPEQLAVAARVAGLRLDDAAFEPPDLSHARAAYQRPVRRVLTPIVGPSAADVVARAVARLTLSEATHGRRAASGAHARRRLFGHTMFAVLVRE